MASHNRPFHSHLHGVRATLPSGPLLAPDWERGASLVPLKTQLPTGSESTCQEDGWEAVSVVR